MKKKGFIALGVAGLLALSMTVPEVSAFAMSALSVFRVADAKTITVTIDDIANVSAYMKVMGEEYEAKDIPSDFGGEDFDGKNFEEALISENTRELSAAAEFTDFPVNLPETEGGIAPNISVIEFKEQSFTMSNGEEVSVSFSPLFVAFGENWAYAATQGFNENFSDEAKQKIKDHVLELPFLSESLCSQIAKIPLDTKDIYLPVIEGISRTVSVGDETGYIYSTSDLSMIMDSLPEEAVWWVSDDEDAAEIKDINATGIVWVNNGVLNILMGNTENISEAELIRLAGSGSN